MSLAMCPFQTGCQKPELCLCSGYFAPVGSLLTHSPACGGQLLSWCECCLPSALRVLIVSLLCVTELCTASNAWCADYTWSGSWQVGCAFSTIKIHLGLQGELDAGSGLISPFQCLYAPHVPSPALYLGLYTRVCGSKGEIWIASPGFI